VYHQRYATQYFALPRSFPKPSQITSVTFYPRGAPPTFDVYINYNGGGSRVLESGPGQAPDVTKFPDPANNIISVAPLRGCTLTHTFEVHTLYMVSLGRDITSLK
jgi:hypothetical protein